MTTGITAYWPAGPERSARAQIGVTGLAVMDRDPVRNCALHGFTAPAGFDWDTDRDATVRNWRGRAWGPGPFDNDTAADWATDLEEADVAAQNAMIRDALTLASKTQSYLHAPDGMAAFAAAAVVSGARPNGWEDGSDYGPSAAALGGLVFDESLRALAARAVARVLDSDSEWRRLWENAQELEEARTELELVLSALKDTAPAGS